MTTQGIGMASSSGEERVGDSVVSKTERVCGMGSGDNWSRPFAEC